MRARRAAHGWSRRAGSSPRECRGDGAPRSGDRGAARHRAGVDEVPRHAVRLVVVDPGGAGPRLEPFAALPRLLRRGDLVVVNDAATLPASLPGRTGDGQGFELRLSGPVE